MALYTRKQVVTCVSIVYLIFVAALAGYASSRANALYIPISKLLTGFTTALPIIAGFLLEGGYDLTRFQERRQGKPKGSTQRPPAVLVANTIIFIYSTVVITLLGTHAAPPTGLNCGLESRWKAMFVHKNARAVRTIQEALSCCGFVNSHDRAWPFPDKGHDAHACEKAFGWTRGCLGPWKAEEQRVAGILMGVVGLVFVWQFTIAVDPTQRESWLHRVVPDRVSRMIADSGEGGSRPRRAIDYLPVYRDNQAEDVSDAEDSTPQRATNGGAQHVRNALTSGEQQSEQHPITENEWSRS